MFFDFFLLFVSQYQRHFCKHRKWCSGTLQCLWHDRCSSWWCCDIAWLVILTMGMGNVLLLSQVIAFLVSFLGSFFIFIPMAMNLQEFDGHCLLGAKGFWNYSSATKTVILMDIEWGLHSDCGFSVFVGVIIMIASVFYIIWQSVYLFKNTDRCVDQIGGSNFYLIYFHHSMVAILYILFLFRVEAI